LIPTRLIYFFNAVQIPDYLLEKRSPVVVKKDIKLLTLSPFFNSYDNYFEERMEYTDLKRNLDQRSSFVRALVIRDFPTYIPQQKRMLKIKYSLASHAFENLSSIPYDPAMSKIHKIIETPAVNPTFN
jgi:hypothetical protein